MTATLATSSRIAWVPGWLRRHRTLIGIATLADLVAFFVLLATAESAWVRSPIGDWDTAFTVWTVAIWLTWPLCVALTVLFICDVIARRLDSRGRWIVGILLLNVFALPVYWWAHMRREPAR